MTFIPSKYQATILNWVETGSGSAVVIAVAGAGKTKTLELALARIPEARHVQMFAFNVTIANELKARITKLQGETSRAFANVRASTFHSVGFGAVARKLNMKPGQIRTDAAKCRKLLDGWLSADDAGIYGEFICKLVGLAKGQGIGALTPDVPSAWFDLIRHHDLYLDSDSDDASEERAIDLARELLQRSNEAAKTGSLDFNDQLYLPLLWRLRLWQNDWVFVDEAQDTNPVRRALAKLALRPGGRLLAVGDPKQALYGFTGASHDAIDIIKREFAAIEMPLTVSFRCAQLIVNKAQTIVPYIEAHIDAPMGRVETLDINAALPVLSDHDAILCRNTAPLIKLAFSLIARGRGCVVLGRDIGAGLTSLVKKMKAGSVDTLEERLSHFADREIAKHTAKGEEQKAEAIADRVECIRTVIAALPETGRTVSAVLARIDSLFSDGNGVVQLATIHKAKGREWERVAILQPELMPSKWARQEWQQEQERNCQYVAYTRAQRELFFLSGTLKAEAAKPTKAKKPAQPVA